MTESGGGTLSDDFTISLSSPLPEYARNTLQLHVQDRDSAFAFSDATLSGGGTYVWSSHGLSWSSGDSISLRMTSTQVPPVSHLRPSLTFDLVVSLTNAFVNSNHPLGNKGYLVQLAGGKNNFGPNRGFGPTPEAFTVKADGIAVRVTKVQISSRVIELTLAQAVPHRAARVTLSYDNTQGLPIYTQNYRSIANSFTDLSLRNAARPAGPGSGGANGKELFHELMTVGYDAVNLWAGYHDGAGGVNPIGSLSEPGFSFGGGDYTVGRVTVSDVGQLALRLNGTLTQPAAARLDLYVGGRTFRFAEASRHVPGESATRIAWPDTGMDWPVGGVYRVQIVDANKPPVFPRTVATNLYLSEDSFYRRDSGQVRDVRGPVSATDADGDTLRYTLEGRDAALFTIDRDTGQIRTRAGLVYDYETEERSCREYFTFTTHTHGSCYELSVRATDSFGASATRYVTIELFDGLDGVLQNLRVEAPAGTNRELRVSWDAASPDERPETYSVYWNTVDALPNRWYRTTVEGDGTGVLLQSLEADTLYRVQVLAHGGDAPVHGSRSETIVKGTGAAGGPVLRRARVAQDGQSVELRFDEALDKSRLPDGDDVFTVTVDGVEVAVASAIEATGLDDRIRLSVSPAIFAGRTVRVRYTDPTPGTDDTSAIQNANGVDAPSFDVEAVNRSPSDPGIGPSPVSGEVRTGGDSVRLTFDEMLDVGLPDAMIWRILADGAEVAVTTAARLASTPNIALIIVEPPIRQGQSVTVSYTDPNPGTDDTTGVLEDTDGNDVESFADFPVTNLSTVAPPQNQEAGPLTAAFRNPPARHTGEAFTFELEFSEEVAVSAEALRDAAFDVTGGSVTAAEKVDAESSRAWTITVTPASAAETVTIALAPKEGCDAAGAICTADGRTIPAPIEAEVPARAATHITGVEVTSNPGANGVWDTGETVRVQVAFNAQVGVHGPPGSGPTLGIALDGARREAGYTGGSGTTTLTFAHAVTAADAGATRARVVANSLNLNGYVIGDTQGQEAGTYFSVAPELSVADAGGAEGTDAAIAFTVTLAPAAATEVTVHYATADGSATAPADYTSTSSTLTFEPGQTSRTVEVPIVDDDVEDDGETFTLTLSNPSGAVLADAEATGTIRSTEAEPVALTAEFLDLPDGGHGANPFTIKLRFSEEFPLSYKTLQNHALGATNGTLTGVSRVTQGEDRAWNVTVTPTGGGAVTVALAATTDCTATGAICAPGGRMLAAVSATVPETAAPPPTPFRVSADLPAEHDGASEIVFEVSFNKEPQADYSYKTLRDYTLRIRQGGESLTPKVRRLNKPHNDRWEVKVTPGSKEDLSVSIGPFTSCSDEGAVCTAADEVLSNRIHRTIEGPPGLSVADARVHESVANAALDFAVTLSRASAATVTVAYATSDGPPPNGATAEDDYEPKSGTLTFEVGETAKTVSVPVIPDDHDENEETLILTLSDPTGGAWLKDATAIGTIENTGPMPQAWLARFGRTVASQVIDAVEGRLSAERAPGVAVSVAGQALGGASADAIERLEEREAGTRLEALSDWFRNGTEGADAGTSQSRALTGRDILTGTSFALTEGSKQAGFASLWGRGAVSRFDGREGELTLEGEVTSAMLGADFTRELGTVGLMLALSRGEGSYRGQGEGTVESTLTGVYPYGRYEVNERVALWGVAGYGTGTLTLTPKDQPAMKADMDLRMGAVGVRGVAVEAPAEGGLELSVTSDAMAVRTSSDAVSGSGGNLAAATADVTRLRLGLEGTWRGGGTLTPTLELGLRHDGGDAETGFGLEVGGGLAWFDPASGLSAELRARGLVTHEAGGFRDRGIAGSLGWDPRPESERGPSLTLSQTLGASASGGMDALLGRGTLEGLAANDDGNGLGNRRLDLKLGYGVGVFGDRFTATPEAGLGLSDGHREVSLGWRLGLEGSGPVSMELGLEGTRREAVNDDGAAPEHALMLRGSLRW